jgi:acyl carrier protein
MDNQPIINQLNLIFTDIIDEGDVELNLNYTANDVEGWDSLNHVLILAAIEKHYGFKFTLFEVQSFKNVEDLVQAIINKAA